MPPPLKLIVTSEHEEVLWEKKFLNTDTSLGMIQAVIFYLIKCFGLWQGKDLKSLKTEHISFGEDNLGKFVTIDVKMALGSGKIIKRYDDPDNPRSVYKILKTYKGYLANEGPFLVRPISSIKDYICYSPWPLGVNIIEQTVVNLMQECGVGSGFGNISVCLMAIDILKSFGAGSHCISTWLFRLYPRYKKTFWADMFKKCCAINCEDKSQEACLMISHILDPPYPAATMLFEMRRKQEIIKNKIETVNAQRTHVFNSWLSNINSKEIVPELSRKSEMLGSNAHIKTKMKLKALTAAKGHIIKIRSQDVKEALKKKINHNDKFSDLNCPQTSDLPESSQITVKTEIMSDIDPYENRSDDSNVKIMTVLSIPESAYSAQIDEAECTSNHQNAEASSHCLQTSAAIKPKCSSLHSRSLAVKRKSSGLRATSKVKQLKPCIKQEEVENSSPCREHPVSHQTQTSNVVENLDQIPSLNVNVKLEPESDCDDNTEAKCDGSFALDDGMKDTDNGACSGGGGNSGKLCQGVCIQNENLPLEEGITSGENFVYVSHNEFNNNLHQNDISPTVSSNSSPDIFSHNDKSQISLLLKDKHMTSETVNLSVLPSTSSFVNSPATKNKDKTVIQHKAFDCRDGTTVDGSSSLSGADELSLDEITKKKSIVRKFQDPGDLEHKMCSHDRGGNHVDIDGSSGVTYINMDSDAFSTSSHQEHLESSEMLDSKNNTKHVDHYSSNNHLAANLVQFLDAAHRQLQNILKTSSTDSSVEYSARKNRINGSLLRSKVVKRGRRLKVVKANMREEISLADGISGCRDTLTPSVRSIALARHKSSSHLRSVCEEKKTPQPKTKIVSAAVKNLPLTSKTNQNKRRFASVRLKTPLSLQSQLELSSAKKRCSGNHGNKMLACSSQKLHINSKDLINEKHIPDNVTTFKGSCSPDEHKSSETAKPQAATHCNLSAHTHVSAETAIIKKVSKDSRGIYHYKSDYHENAIYQNLQVKQDQGTTTFTISDLPIHVDGQKDCLHSQRSEVCLGDYLPEGTVIPARGVRLLTRQTAAGLELVLKFDFKIHDSPANEDCANDSKESKEQGEGHSKFVNDKQCVIQVCSDHQCNS